MDFPKKYIIIRVVIANLDQCERTLNEKAGEGYVVKIGEVTPSGMIVVMEYQGEPSTDDLLAELDELEAVTAEAPAEAAPTYPMVGNGKKAPASRKPQGKYKPVI